MINKKIIARGKDCGCQSRFYSQFTDSYFEAMTMHYYINYECDCPIIEIYEEIN